MSKRKMPKAARACTYDTRQARREGEALALVVEALEICDSQVEQARVIRHACSIIGVRTERVLAAFNEG